MFSTGKLCSLGSNVMKAVSEQQYLVSSLHGRDRYVINRNRGCSWYDDLVLVCNIFATESSQC
jgi:hypothetical protein